MTIMYFINKASLKSSSNVLIVIDLARFLWYEIIESHKIGIA